MNKKEIEQQAKQILDKFARALEKVKTSKFEKESYVDREEFMREEKEGKESDNEFKKRMLENSHKHNNDFIIAEKGDWI